MNLKDTPDYRLSGGIVALFFLAVSNVWGAPEQDLARLLKESQPAKVIFSDGHSTWAKNVPVFRLGNKAVIVHAQELALDTDGAVKAVRTCDATSQASTALPDLHGKPTDANSIPYFVLPWCGGAKNMRRCKANPPYAQLGLHKGDLAAVVAGPKLTFAIAETRGRKRNSGRARYSCIDNSDMRLSG